MNRILTHIVGATILFTIPAMQKGCVPVPPAEPNSVPAAKEATMETEDKSLKPQAENKTPEPQMPQTEREWKQKLDRKQYYVLREKGTERAFTGKYDKFFGEGVYKCAGCGNVIFSSEAKYNSGCGWPAFSAPANDEAVAERRDTSHGMNRIEIYCPKCGGHLGHVFNDGPAPTGQRYCINSAALDFEKEDKSLEK